MSDPVLVIGGSGFIGRHLVRALAASGTRVISAGRHHHDHGHPLVEPVVGTFDDPHQFQPLIARSRAVVHLATHSTPGTSAGKPLSEVSTNLRSICALLEAMQAHPEVELLYMSSGGSLYADAADAGSTEDSPVRPRSYHGAAKLAAEAFINAWCAQTQGRATILRPSNVYGPGQPEHAGFGVIPAAFGRLSRGETMHVWGDGSARRDYVYVDDLVRLCLAILAAPMPAGCRTFNACSGESTSLNELIDMVSAVANRKLHVSYEAGRSVDAACIAMDGRLAQRVYGWRHLTPLHEGLAHTWERLAGDAKALPDALPPTPPAGHGDT